MKKFKILLYPISLIYGLLVGIRNIFFDIGILDSKIYKIPTIGIGNLSIGGTGKSILVDYLINLFKSSYNITTLSRGYNRDTKGFVHANIRSTAYEIGDEPFQFYSKHPEINVTLEDLTTQIFSQTLSKTIPSKSEVEDVIYKIKITDDEYFLVLESHQQ